MAFCSLTPENKRKMTSTESDVRMQNAIWMDMAAFLTTYPQLQKALKYGLGALVRTRPPDPFSFLAEKLREANRKEKIVVKGKALTEEEAAVRIQARVTTISAVLVDICLNEIGTGSWYARSANRQGEKAGGDKFTQTLLLFS
mmetsp:Transcript_18998/g.52308  ORF Transcript_18998/g.52308 Transcript_18998/m.52308 type:complete len:143 (+) Transcript_18998:2-430(+)